MHLVHNTGPAAAVEISGTVSANILRPLAFADVNSAVSHSNRTFPEHSLMRKCPQCSRFASMYQTGSDIVKIVIMYG
jgi:hypothetical protein